MTEQEIQILEAMLSRIEQCEETIHILMDSNKKLVHGNQILSESLEALRQEYRDYSDNCIYEIFDPRLTNKKIFYPHIYTISETLDTLLNGEKSLCRFGDGEFACINGRLRATFTTKYYEELSRRLKEVLTSADDSIMIAIADNYGDISPYIPSSRREIRNYMTHEIRDEHAALLDCDRYYYNAYITRPFMFSYSDMNQMSKYMERIKSLWSDRSVTVIEGSSTGMGVGNDLLNGCSEVKRIIAPAIDAYAKYDDILNAALSQKKSDLYLLALGPVATVLAYDIAKTGRRAVDIGHLDIEYEWMKRGTYRIPIPGKYVNEVTNGNISEPINNREYKDQIVTIV